MEDSLMDAQKKYVMGIDYGTDSCRVVVTDSSNGNEIASAVAPFPRWLKGLYCDPNKNQFRQHPRDYIESLESAMAAIRRENGEKVLLAVRGVAIDTTGSTPCLATAHLQPLALLPQFEHDPDAMFVLWKDHTATEEASRINELAGEWNIDFTQYEGGIYSSEWFWAKLLHIANTHPALMEAGYTALEHCDWMPALLTATEDPRALKRSRCAMGHKAMWHESFGGYPSDDFLAKLHPELVRVKATLGTETFETDEVFGRLSREWALKLGLPEGIPVAVGAIDAHVGAVGGGIEEGVLVKVMGTSTCDMIVGPRPASRGAAASEHLVRGICGQVDGSIIPGMLGYEAGQSAFGDVYAWFKNLLMWPLKNALGSDSGKAADGEGGAAIAGAAALAASIEENIMTSLERAASAVDPGESSVLALDWLNGRRTPDANQKLKGAIVGLTLGSSAPALYRALIEATAFGTRAIVERFEQEGVAIKKIRGIGGVARKSPLVMQIVADVLGRPIEIVANDQSVALGAAMFASVVARIYANIPEAQSRMKPRIETTVRPAPACVELYDRLYARYQKLGSFIERELS